MHCSSFVYLSICTFLHIQACNSRTKTSRLFRFGKIVARAYVAGSAIFGQRSRSQGRAKRTNRVTWLMNPKSQRVEIW